jgi:hypothetical protein
MGRRAFQLRPLRSGWNAGRSAGSRAEDEATTTRRRSGPLPYSAGPASGAEVVADATAAGAGVSAASPAAARRAPARR